MPSFGLRDKKKPTSRSLVVSNLVDLGLQVRDDLPRDLVAEQLEQVDALIAGDGLDGRHLDALLDALDGGIARDQLLRLGLSDGLVREGGTVPFLGGGHGHRNEGEQTDGYFHFRAVKVETRGKRGVNLGLT